MPKDKSLFFYGSIYNRLLDPQLAECRQKTVDLVPEAATVLDIACGTGQLCFELKIHKHCHVTGLDLSLRMLEFARKSNSFQDISFVHEDATNLHSFKDSTFDYATMLMILHELPRPQQIGMLKEALRVAKRAIIVDSVVPLPKNLEGIGIRLVEATLGHEHNPNFKTFLSTGGIHGILQESDLQIKIEHSSVFCRNCREVVVVTK